MSLFHDDDEWAIHNPAPSLPDVIRTSRQSWKAALQYASTNAFPHPSDSLVVDYSTPHYDPSLNELPRFPEDEHGDAEELLSGVKQLTSAFSDVLLGDTTSLRNADDQIIVGFAVGLSEATEQEIVAADLEDHGVEIAARSRPAFLVYSTEPVSADDMRRRLNARVRLDWLTSKHAEVRVVHESIARAAFRQRRRPVCGGCSVSHFSADAVGTFGTLVVGRQGRRRRRMLVLSNAHVLAPSGFARRGDGIIQPGINDLGMHPDDQIGIVERIIHPRSGVPNLIDAATARVDPKLVSRGFLVAGSRGTSHDRSPARVLRPVLGMPVRKSGRTTQTTRGYVRAIGASIRVEYRPGVEYELEDQIDIADRPRQPVPVADLGDSGSVIWAYRRGRPAGAIGLLTAIRTNARTGRVIAVANRMRNVLLQLDVSLYP